LESEERETIGLMAAAGRSDAQIAAVLGRDRTTVWRERCRHATAAGGYRPLRAHQRAQERAQTTHRRVPKLVRPGRLRDYVVAGLQQQWSPAEIAARIRVDHPDPVDAVGDEVGMRVCAETIYRTFFLQTRGTLKKDLTAPATTLRSGRTRRKPRGQRRGRDDGRGRLIDTVSIRERPAEADDRSVPGHWEGDLIVGRDNGSAIGTLVERTTRFVMLVHLPGRRRAEEFLDALVPTIHQIPPHLRRSLTWDNGKEMALHHKITIATDMKIYFADPQSPWQRGSNENTNGLLRQYFPKGISLRQFTPTDLARVAAQLNGRPRQTLGWATPAERLNDILDRPFEPTVLR
jgi:IS30 family transposase